MICIPGTLKHFTAECKRLHEDYAHVFLISSKFYNMRLRYAPARCRTYFR